MLQGKVAVITGAGNGFGVEIAKGVVITVNRSYVFANASSQMHNA